MAKSKKKESGSRSRNPLARHKKPLLIGLGLAAVLGGGYHLFNLNQLNNELQIEQAVQPWNVSVTGITIRIDVILKNPTPGSIQVKTPNLTATFNGELLGNSDNISGEDHLIPAYGTVALDPIYITLKFLTLALTAKKFWAQYTSVGKAVVAIRALTRVNGMFPVEQTTVFDLSKTPVGKTAPVVATSVTKQVVLTNAKVVPPAARALPTTIPVARTQALALPPDTKRTATTKRVVAGKRTLPAAKGAPAAAKKAGAKRPTVPAYVANTPRRPQR